MSHVQYVDELIREYLLYRGFSGTLKAFDSELKVDKDKSFRVRKFVIIMFQILVKTVYLSFAGILLRSRMLDQYFHSTVRPHGVALITLPLYSIQLSTVTQ
jgi:hypothetical protein